MQIIIKQAKLGRATLEFCINSLNKSALKGSLSDSSGLYPSGVFGIGWRWHPMRTFIYSNSHESQVITPKNIIKNVEKHFRSIFSSLQAISSKFFCCCIFQVQNFEIFFEQGFLSHSPPPIEYSIYTVGCHKKTKIAQIYLLFCVRLCIYI